MKYQRSAIINDAPAYITIRTYPAGPTGKYTIDVLCDVCALDAMHEYKTTDGIGDLPDEYVYNLCRLIIMRVLAKEDAARKARFDNLKFEKVDDDTLKIQETNHRLGR